MKALLVIVLILLMFVTFYSLFLLSKTKNRSSLVTNQVESFTGKSKLERWVIESQRMSYRRYILFHALIAFLLIIGILYSMLTYNDQIFWGSLRATIVVILAFDFFMWQFVLMYRKRIIKDLIRVHEIHYWQSKINMSDEVILAYCATIVNGPLKQKIQELAGCYRLKRDIIPVLMELRMMSPVEELHSFTYMLEEKYKTGMTEDYHKGSMTMLKRFRRIDKKFQAIANMQLLAISMLMLMVLFFIVVGGPLLYSAFIKFKIVVS